jgi:hypothetical protein
MNVDQGVRLSLIEEALKNKGSPFYGDVGTGKDFNVVCFVLDETFDSTNTVETKFLDTIQETGQAATVLADTAVAIDVSKAGASGLPLGSKFVGEPGKFFKGLMATPDDASKFATIVDRIKDPVNAITDSERTFLQTKGVFFDDASRTIKSMTSSKNILKLENATSYKALLNTLKESGELKGLKESRGAYKMLSQVANDVRSYVNSPAYSGAVANPALNADKVRMTGEITAKLEKLYKAGSPLVTKTDSAGRTVYTVLADGKKLLFTIDDVAGAGKMLKATEEVGGSIVEIAGTGARYADNAFAVTAAAKPGIISRAYQAIKNTRVVKGASKIFKFGGIYLGIPHAIVNNTAIGVLALTSLPNVSPPSLMVKDATSVDGKLIGAKYIVDPQFELNVKRFKALKDSFDGAIDESYGGAGNLVWETTAFFDPSELIWLGADYLPAMKDNEQKFLVQNGCSVAVATDSDPAALAEYFKNKKCIISDIKNDRYNNFELPNGTHMLMVFARFNQEYTEKVMTGEGPALPNLPDFVRNLYYKSGDKSAAMSFLTSAGFPSNPGVFEISGVSYSGNDTVWRGINVDKWLYDSELSKINSVISMTDSKGISVIKEIKKDIKDGKNIISVVFVDGQPTKNETYSVNVNYAVLNSAYPNIAKKYLYVNDGTTIGMRVVS